MNTKKLIGMACWLLAFLLPARYSLVESEQASNLGGLVWFLAFLFLMFLGFWLVESSAAKRAYHGH